VVKSESIKIISPFLEDVKTSSDRETVTSQLLISLPSNQLFVEHLYKEKENIEITVKVG
jgi:hypothetical protein